MKVLLDSNIWISLFRESDTNHDRGISIMKKMETNFDTVTHNLILLEVLTILKMRKLPKLEEISRKFILGILAEFDDTEFTISHELIDLFIGDKKDIGIIDSFLLQLCQQKSYQLATFDNNLSRAARKMGIKVFRNKE